MVFAHRGGATKYSEHVRVISHPEFEHRK